MPREAQTDREAAASIGLQSLIDRFDKDPNALRDACLSRLRKALEPYERKPSKIEAIVWRVRAFLEQDLFSKSWSPYTENSWRSTDMLMGGLYHAVFVERFLADGANELDVVKHADDYRSTVAHQLMAEKLECTPEQLEKLLDCIEKGFSDEVAKRKDVP